MASHAQLKITVVCPLWRNILIDPSPFPSYPLPYVDPISAYPLPRTDPPSIISICEAFWLTLPPFSIISIALCWPHLSISIASYWPPFHHVHLRDILIDSMALLCNLHQVNLISLCQCNDRPVVLFVLNRAWKTILFHHHPFCSPTDKNILITGQAPEQVSNDFLKYNVKVGLISIVFTNLTQAQFCSSKWQNANVSTTQCGLHCVHPRSNVTGLEYRHISPTWTQMPCCLKWLLWARRTRLWTRLPVLFPEVRIRK